MAQTGRHLKYLSALVLASVLGAGVSASAETNPSKSEATGDESRSGTADATGGGRDASRTSERKEDEEFVDPVLRRAPRKVREAPVAFSTDLRPISPKRAKVFLEELCAASPVQLSLEGREGRVWACERCPSFTSHAESKGPFVLEKIVRGSFIKSGKQEVFTTYRGCEPKTAAFGGAVIFRKRSSGWEPFYKHPGLHPQGCLKFSSKKHGDALACRVRYPNRGRIAEKIVDGATKRGAVELAGAIDNSGRCPTGLFNSSYMVGWEKKDATGDGTPDLVVDKVQRHEPLGKKNKKRVCRLEQSDGTWDRARRQTIIIELKGKRLRRTKRTNEPLPPEARTADNYASIDSESESTRGEEAAVERRQPETSGIRAARETSGGEQSSPRE